MLIPGSPAKLQDDVSSRFHIVTGDGDNFVHEREDRAQRGLDRIPAVDGGVAV